MSESHDATRITDGLGHALEDQRELLQDARLLRPHPHRHRHGARTARRRMARDLQAIHIETYGPGFDIVKEMNPRYAVPGEVQHRVLRGRRAGGGPRGTRTVLARSASAEGVRDRAIAACCGARASRWRTISPRNIPAAWPARLTVTLARRHGAARREPIIPRGNPENPVSTAELEEKFLSLVAAAIRAGRPPAAPSTPSRSLETLRGHGRACSREIL